MDIAERLFAYEDGQLTHAQQVELFADLIACGWIWHLQGAYQRTASDYVMAGLISPPDGELLAEPEEEFIELHAELARNGMAWTIPGRIGRTCVDLIEGGYISLSGEVLKTGFEDDDAY